MQPKAGRYWLGSASRVDIVQAARSSLCCLESQTVTTAPKEDAGDSLT